MLVKCVCVLRGSDRLFVVYLLVYQWGFLLEDGRITSSTIINSQLSLCFCKPLIVKLCGRLRAAEPASAVWDDR